MIQTMQVQGRRYSKPLKINEQKYYPKTEQSLVSENMLSTNPCKHQYKYSFFRIIQNYSKEIAQSKHAHISVRVLCFSDGKTAGSILPYSKLLLNNWEFEKMFNMTKFRIFGSFSMVYYLHHFNKLFNKITFKTNFNRI